MADRRTARPSTADVAQGTLHLLRSTPLLTQISGVEIQGQFGVTERTALAALRLLLGQDLIRPKPGDSESGSYKNYELTTKGRGTGVQ